MKKMLLILVITVLFETSLFAQYTSKIDYSNYHTWLFDDFDSYTCDSFKYNSAFNAKWSITNGDWGAENEYYYADNVTMDTCGYIRLTENDLGFSFYAGSPPRLCTKSSGGLALKDSFFCYGIIEARIRFSQSHIGGVLLTPAQAANPAFWTGVEIDVFDDAIYGDWLPHRVIDWTVTPQHFNSPLINISPIVTSTETITDLSTEFHVYSSKWTPNMVFYYIDSTLLASVPYTDVRTYQDYNGLQIALLANTSALSGQYMDIDWVKVWMPNCNPLPLNVTNLSDTNLFYVAPLINPGMWKYKSISMSIPFGGPFFIPQTIPDQATIFEGEAITLNQNFIADESITTKKLVTDDSVTHLIPSNGYFEIIPIICGEDNDSWFRKADTSKGTTVSNISNSPTINNSIADNDHLSRFAQIQVFPNPTQDNINITYPCTIAGPLEITIKDVAGRIRYTESVDCIEGNNVQHSVDLSPFVPGVYFIDLTSMTSML